MTNTAADPLAAGNLVAAATAEELFAAGNKLFHQGQYPAAIEKYQQATVIKPDHAKAYNNWGSALGELGQYPAAIEKYKKSIRYTAKFCFSRH